MCTKCWNRIFLNHLIKAKETVFLEFILGNWNQARKYNLPVFHTFVVGVVLSEWIFLFVFVCCLLSFIFRDKNEYCLSIYKE